MAPEEDALCCGICGEPILPEERRYELPDGTVLCTDPDCLEQWLEAYTRLGSIY